MLFDDCHAETDARVVGAYAFGAAKKRLGNSGNHLWVSCSPVFSTVSTTLSGSTLVVTALVGRLCTIALTLSLDHLRQNLAAFELD